ncbi:MAG: hypothetical protein K2K79_03405 [Paramuribaculum sp.]|nr:hypothetical protein [Paramuribaculum sp.]
MKKFPLIALSLMCALFSIHADVFSHTFKFDPDKFSITVGAGDSLCIRSIADPSSHSDPSQPDLPIISRSIAIPGNADVDNYSVTIHKHIIRKG